MGNVHVQGVRAEGTHAGYLSAVLVCMSKVPGQAHALNAVAENHGY